MRFDLFPAIIRNSDGTNAELDEGAETEVNMNVVGVAESTVNPAGPSGAGHHYVTR